MVRLGVRSLLRDKRGHIDDLPDLARSIVAQGIATKPELNGAPLEFSTGWVVIRVPLQPDLGRTNFGLPLRTGFGRILGVAR